MNLPELTKMLALPFLCSGLLISLPTNSAPTPPVAPKETVTAQDDQELEHILRLEGEESPAAEIDQLAWMEGSWRGEALGGVCEETWSKPAGGAMMGMFRLLKDGKVSFYEFVTLREHEGTISYRLKHFHADLKGWEEKDTVVEFPLVEIDEEGAWFDGLTILREGEDRLVQYVAIQQGAKVEEIRFDLHRVKEQD